MEKRDFFLIGAPHFGQVGAEAATGFWQTGQLIRAIGKGQKGLERTAFILHENNASVNFSDSHRVKKTRLSKSKNVIGERVRRARLAMTPVVSQDDLCGRLAREGIIMNQTSVSKLENGERYVMDYEAQALAKVLKVSIAWLYSEE